MTVTVHRKDEKKTAVWSDGVVFRAKSYSGLVNKMRVTELVPFDKNKPYMDGVLMRLSDIHNRFFKAENEKRFLELLHKLGYIKLIKNRRRISCVVS